MLRNVRN